MISRRAALLLLPASALSISSCSTVAGSLEHVAGVPADGADLDPEEFAKAIRAPRTVILDVRTPEEFAAGHIEGARNIDVSAPGFADEIATLDHGDHIAVYCRSGSRSADAIAQMRKLGYTSTYHLEGGIQAWTSTGHALAP